MARRLPSPRTWLATSGLALALMGAAGPARAADDPGVRSPQMRAISVDEQRGNRLDGALAFTDHTGRRVTLGQLFADGKPTIMTLNYFTCKVVCSVQLDGLASALGKLDWTPGREDFRVITVSIDPRDTPKMATHKRAMMIEKVGRGDDLDWQFLTGDALSIQALAAQLGVGFAYDAERDQYAHPAVAVFLAPGGKVTQYIYGLTYEPRDLKFALMEAGQGKLGSPMEQLIMSCFHYDASVGRYGPFAFGIMRLGGTITFVVLGTVLLVLWRRERWRGGKNAEAKT